MDETSPLLVIKVDLVNHSETSAFNSIGAFFTGLVSSNENPEPTGSKEKILCARFGQLDQNLYLLIGYPKGFQVWETNGNSFQERVSVKSLEKVHDIHVFLLM